MGYFWRAALVAIGFGFCAEALANDAARPSTTTLPTNTTMFETSVRYRFAWTEIPFRRDLPKGWDEISGPEERIGIRVLSGMFEGKLEIGMISERFDTFSIVDADLFRGDAQLGVNIGAWSALVEWKGRDVFEPGFTEFITGLNIYDLRVRRRLTLDLFDGAPAALVQASVAGGRVAASPHFHARNFGEIEVEAVQPFGGGFALMVAPRFAYEDFDDYTRDREDTIFSLRLSPSYNFGGGLTFSLEGQAVIAFSTLSNKTGETWSVTPVLRYQRAL
jgi:hypothetical protein